MCLGQSEQALSAHISCIASGIYCVCEDVLVCRIKPCFCVRLAAMCFANHKVHGMVKRARLKTYAEHVFAHLLGERQVSRQLATENPCMRQAVHFGPCKRANDLEVQLPKMRERALDLRLVKFCLL